MQSVHGDILDKTFPRWKGSYQSSAEGSAAVCSSLRQGSGVAVEFLDAARLRRLRSSPYRSLRRVELWKTR